MFTVRAVRGIAKAEDQMRSGVRRGTNVGKGLRCVDRGAGLDSVLILNSKTTASGFANERLNGNRAVIA